MIQNNDRDLGLKVLRKVIGQALSQAGNSLAQMSGREISLEGPGLEIVPIQDFMNLAGGPDVAVAAVYLNVTGDFAGHLMLLLPIHQVPELIEMVLGDMEIDEDPDASPLDNEVNRSVLGELGNVVGTSFLNVMGNKLEMVILPSIPYILTDFAGSILSSLALQASTTADEYWDQFLVVNTRFKEIEKRIQGFFLLLPQPGTLDEFLNKVANSENVRS